MNSGDIHESIILLIDIDIMHTRNELESKSIHYDTSNITKVNKESTMITFKKMHSMGIRK